MQVQLGAVLADDREEVTLILEGDQVPGAFLKQDAAELSGTIERLAIVRANMKPEVVRELDPGSRGLPVVDPIWRGTAAPDGTATLAFRHPGYGWIVLQLPPGETATLGKFLVTSAGPTPIATPA
ncbi:hypothetical protein [Xanthobacter flavus]|uniref:hypothetical protein n=1 Tax=Xanthobacter flavus TaxID=281 RepID=UPI00372838A0